MILSNKIEKWLKRLVISTKGRNLISIKGVTTALKKISPFGRNDNTTILKANIQQPKEVKICSKF